MKLRLRGNSLRIRLRQPEVAQLGDGLVVEDTTALGPTPAARLTCRLVPSAVEAIASDFSDGVLTVSIPATEAAAWFQGEEVGLYAQTDWGLAIAIEKDFRCLETRPDEDDSDAFARPVGGQPGPCAVDAD